MSRKIFFSSSASTDTDLMDVGDVVGPLVLLWPWILTGLDDWGRGTGDPRAIKAALFPSFPIGEDDIAAALAAFIDAGLLIAYTDDRGRPLVAVANIDAWWRWQTHIHKSKRDDDTKSKFPKPPRTTTPDHSAESRGNPRGSAQLSASPRPSSPHFTSLQPSPPRDTAAPPGVENPPSRPKAGRAVKRIAAELDVDPDELLAAAMAVAAERETTDRYPVRDRVGFAIGLIRDRDAEVTKRARRSADPPSGSVSGLLDRLGTALDLGAATA